MATKPSDVRTIANFEELDDPDLEAFIDDATTFVSNRTGLDKEHPYATGTYDKVVKWVSAHLASMKQKRVVEEGLTDASLSYEGETGMMLNFTRYGQQAIILDPTNSLSNKDGTESDYERHYTRATQSDEEYEPLGQPNYPTVHHEL